MKELKDKNFLKKLFIEKKKVLNIIGSHEWRVQKHYWKKNILRVEGDYTDASGIATKFVEVHYYSKNRLRKILYTYPKFNKFIKQNLLTSLLSEYGMNK